mmetsp:Transcript_136362/g.423721  ORF Transcript_136362/g.423721 Transcript_136362/m.423721 type:complete len:556 (-) Transcript_136362:57-1724(-)
MAWRRLLVATVLMLTLAPVIAPTYTLLNPGSTCADYSINGIGSEAECFNAAKNAVGLSGLVTFSLNSSGFNGCIYNVDANLVLFGHSATSLALSSWRYICDGVPTTTTTTTTTATTVTTTTVTLPAVTSDVYSLINHFENCAEYQLPDVDNSSECFDKARLYVGLSAVQAFELPGMGFTGCVYHTQNNYVLYGVQAGSTGGTSGAYKYICKGLATTTSTFTATSTVTTTTSSTATTTATSTTSTTSSTTATSTTSATNTTTATTSTETTLTTSTSTDTSSTSTATTTTYTGSSSTFTTETSSTSTLTLTTSSTTTSTTTETFTATTSTQSTSTQTTWTQTTSTFTTIPGAASAGFVGDDPLTYFGDVTKQFWLPDGTLVELLSTPELRLLGSAFNVGSEQWINRLVLLGPAGEAVMQVAIRRDIATHKPEEAPADAFATLNVTLDWLGGLPLKAIPPPEAFAYTWGSVVFAFGRLPHFRVGPAAAEVVVIEGTSARIVVTSVAASGFEGAEAHLAAEYAHLDFVLQMKQRDTCEGILPELWGLRPLSNETEAMIY